MFTPPDMEIWQGRIDQEPEGDARRWHQCVSPLPPDGKEPGIALLGICCDTGVKRNLGRPGAVGGPDAIRRALANQAWHLSLPCYDLGNIHCTDDNLESLHREQVQWVANLLKADHFPLLLGGGHEMAFGTYLGLVRYLEQRETEETTVGIINFDAHFDLRKSATPNSGTPFLQIAEDCTQRRRPFRYFCLGISETANTAALFGRAKSLGATWLLDEQLTSWNLQAAQESLRSFIIGCDLLYVSIDLDVLPASVAPGVSAPAPRGVPLEIVEHLLALIRAEGGRKLRLAEIAECNPNFDIDVRTAKVAARLCHVLMR